MEDFEDYFDCKIEEHPQKIWGKMKPPDFYFYYADKDLSAFVVSKKTPIFIGIPKSEYGW